MVRPVVPSVLVALVLLILAAPSQASPSFPDALRSDLTLPDAPGCDLCHTSAVTPVGDAGTPFAHALEARGLVADDTASLAAALASMRADDVDSDGDGARDLDELSWGGDPNVADLPDDGRKAPLLYGCVLSPRPTTGTPYVAGVLGALLLTLHRRSRSRSRRTRRATTTR